MTELQIKLRCTRCESFQDFERDPSSRAVVRCDRCGKRHSADSLHAIDPDDAP